MATHHISLNDVFALKHIISWFCYIELSLIMEAVSVARVRVPQF